MKEKLEITKSILVCVLLLIAILTSCSARKTASEIVGQIVQLQAVVDKQGEQIEEIAERTETVLRTEE